MEEFHGKLQQCVLLWVMHFLIQTFLNFTFLRMIGKLCLKTTSSSTARTIHQLEQLLCFYFNLCGSYMRWAHTVGGQHKCCTWSLSVSTGSRWDCDFHRWVTQARWAAEHSTITHFISTTKVRLEVALTEFVPRSNADTLSCGSQRLCRCHQTAQKA